MRWRGAVASESPLAAVCPATQVEKELSSLEVSCRSQEERHLEALKSSQFLEVPTGHPPRRLLAPGGSVFVH